MNLCSTFDRSLLEPSRPAPARTQVAEDQTRPGNESPCPDTANLTAWTRLAAAQPTPPSVGRGSALPLAPWRSGQISRRVNDDAADDWEGLFNAVMTRLGDSLAESPAASAELREIVADCVLARTELLALRARQCGGD